MGGRSWMRGGPPRNGLPIAIFLLQLIAFTTLPCAWSIKIIDSREGEQNANNPFEPPSVEGDSSMDPNVGYALAMKKAKSADSTDPEVQAAQPAYASRRTLKYGTGCSEYENSISAIVECTNAVRRDPDAFARDYPCFYEGWRREVVGKNLVQLSVHPTLNRMAQLHSDDQARINTMTHRGSDGSTLNVRADRVGFRWSSLGENVAVGFSSAKQVVMAWMCSAGHRKNVMSCNFDLIGIGVAQSARTYHTQNFGCAEGRSCSCSAARPPPRVAPAPVPRPTPVPQPTPVPPPQQSQSVSTANNGLQQNGWSCGWVGQIWNCERMPQAAPPPATPQLPDLSRVFDNPFSFMHG